MSKLDYRNSFVLLAAGFVLLCILYIAFGPETSGRYALKTDGELNIRGWAALLAGLLIFVFSLPHVFHVLIRRPALEIRDGELQIWMLPYQRIPLGEISKIEVGDGTIDILQHGRRKRRINARVLDQPRAFFFDDVRAQLTDKNIVKEK